LPSVFQPIQRHTKVARSRKIIHRVHRFLGWDLPRQRCCRASALPAGPPLRWAVRKKCYNEGISACGANRAIKSKPYYSPTRRISRRRIAPRYTPTRSRQGVTASAKRGRAITLDQAIAVSSGSIVLRTAV